MNRSSRILARSPLALVLALALAACGGADDAAGSGEAGSEPIAKVAAPQGQAWSEVVTRTEEGGYLMGNPDAPIKLLEFASLSCHVCADFSNDGAEAIKNQFVDSGRVSYEYRNYLRGPIDLIGAQIMECGTPERVIPLTEQHFARFEEFSQGLSDPRLQQIASLPQDQQNLAVAEISGLLEFFAQRGVSRDEAASCLADEAKATTLAQRSTDWATQYDISGTPTIYINGNKIPETRWSNIAERLEALGAR